MRIDQLRRDFDLDIRWSVFPLHPETPDDGMMLDDLFAGRIDIDTMQSRLKGIAAELDLPFGDRRRTFNSRRAQELGKWAEEKGQGDAFHLAVYRAYFVDGRNIARADVLASIAEGVGLDAESALRALGEQRFTAAVDADWDRAGRLGVTAVPTLVYRDRHLVGFQPYGAFRRLVVDAE